MLQKTYLDEPLPNDLQKIWQGCLYSELHSRSVCMKKDDSNVICLKKLYIKSNDLKFCLNPTTVLFASTLILELKAFLIS